jgi:hypothetical protein
MFGARRRWVAGQGSSGMRAQQVLYTHMHAWDCCSSAAAAAAATVLAVLLRAAIAFKQSAAGMAIVQSCNARRSLQRTPHTCQEQHQTSNNEELHICRIPAGLKTTENLEIARSSRTYGVLKHMSTRFARCSWAQRVFPWTFAATSPRMRAFEPIKRRTSPLQRPQCLRSSVLLSRCQQQLLRDKLWTEQSCREQGCASSLAYIKQTPRNQVGTACTCVTP